jgi:hypothetical protein
MIATDVLTEPEEFLKFLLESEAHSELHLARVPGAGDAAEVRTSEDAVRHIEIRAIEKVEDLPSQFEPSIGLRRGDRCKRHGRDQSRA